jgi:hypothetical protein
MKILLPTMLGSVILAGGLVPALVPVVGAAEQVYRGEVWTWDEARGTVTLLRGAETVRVKIAPDQLRTLRLHEQAIVRGELDGPAPIEQVVTQAAPMQAVPRGPVDQSDVAGSVSTVDPNGLVVLESQQGKLTAWAAPGVDSRFPAGQAVRLRTTVQIVEMVPETQAPGAAAATAAATQTPGDPAASVSSEPGDYAVVTGRVMAVNPQGTITVESPRGPVTVAVTDPSRYQPGMTVRIRTALQPMR